MDEIMDGIFVAKDVELFLRKAVGGGIMLLGVIRCSNEVSKKFENGELWITDLTVNSPKRYRVEKTKYGESVAGMRADQILCSSFDINRMEKIV